MASFIPVLPIILRIEGGWVDDPDDTGGETWQGVARNVNPNWPGWLIVDDAKRRNPIFTQRAYAGKPQELNKLLYGKPGLAKLVSDFYESLYWDVNQLDRVNNQQLARNVCDCGVNCGTRTGAKMLQRAYNISRSPFDTPLIEDGKIGHRSIAAINKANTEVLYNTYNQLRAAYYNAIIARKPSQSKYRKSWFSRIIPYKP